MFERILHALGNDLGVCPFPYVTSLNKSKIGDFFFTVTQNQEKEFLFLLKIYIFLLFLDGVLIL